MDTELKVSLVKEVLLLCTSGSLKHDDESEG